MYALVFEAAKGREAVGQRGYRQQGLGAGNQQKGDMTTARIELATDCELPETEL